MTEKTPETRQRQRELLDQHTRKRRGGLLREYWAFLVHQKKWYMLPVVGVLAILGLLIVAGGTGAAPFLYTLF